MVTTVMELHILREDILLGKLRAEGITNTTLHHSSYNPQWNIKTTEKRVMSTSLDILAQAF